MNPKLFVQCALGPALGLLPAWMDTTEARVMVLAILLQESRLQYRRQIGGPARGYAQFELAGIRAVMSHRDIGPIALLVLQRLDYPVLPAAYTIAHDAIEHNDVLCAAFARLLLYSDPKALPKKPEQQTGWEQYLRCWRPGKPHPETWAACWTRAWTVVDSTGDA